MMTMLGWLSAEAARASRLELAADGGHCGFIEDWAMHGYGERWIAERIIASERAFGQTGHGDDGDAA